MPLHPPRAWLSGQPNTFLMSGQWPYSTLLCDTSLAIRRVSADASMRLVEYNRDDRSIVPQPPPIYRFHTYTPCARSTDDQPAPVLVPPMITPTARSTTFPRIMNFLNSSNIGPPIRSTPSGRTSFWLRTGQTANRSRSSKYEQPFALGTQFPLMADSGRANRADECPL
jgi:hypothetical protein